MKDPVRAIEGDVEITVEREYAQAMSLEILPDEPVYAHGRLRGVTRVGGRQIKPKVNLPKAIPTPTTPDAASAPDGPRGGIGAAESKEN